MMRKVKEYFGFMLAALSFVLCVSSCLRADRYVVISGFAQGGTYTVKFNMNGRDGKVAVPPEEIRDSVDAILSRIDASLSGYNRNSLLSRFNAGERIVPDEIFLDIYGLAGEYHAVTDGAVDVASAPLFDLWGFGFASDSLPDVPAVGAMLAESGMGRLKKDMRAAVADDGSLCASDMLQAPGRRPELNYNAIAQGYSCDLVASYLYSIGVTDMMVDIGEIFCDGRNPSGMSWTLGIDRPEDGNNDPGAMIQGIFRAPEGPHGIVTSGNYRKFHVRDGRKYSHTIDPRTGYPVDHSLLSATIVAPDAVSADAYATYCMVVGLDEAKEFISSRADLEGCLIYDEDGVFRTWCSEGFLLEEHDSHAGNH